jgi:hypothetical protein
LSWRRRWPTFPGASDAPLAALIATDDVAGRHAEDPPVPKRLHYIDWLRVLAVLLLFPFHTSRVFNAGEPFYIKSASCLTG